jgi:hypothetical protein
MTTKIQAFVIAALVVAGAAALALPGALEGPVLVPISTGHGLSAVDSVGAASLAVGITWLEAILLIRLPRLRLGARTLFGTGLLAGLGLGLLLASVYTAFWWWAVGAALFTVVLAGLTVGAARSRDA